mgnify:FL=1
MKRRTFLRTGIAASVAGLAGCPGGGGDDTPTNAESGTDAETPTPTEMATASPAPTATPPEKTDRSTPTPEETSALPRLRTDESWIVTEDGERFTPRGANVIEPLFGHRNETNRGGTYEDTLEMAIDPERAWYNNIVRLPITTWGIDQIGYEEYASRFVDPTVERCRKAGVYVIVDYHIIQDWQNEEVHQGVREFWDFFAPRYADHNNVLYEFWNEPQNPADNTLENWNAWKEVAQPLVDRIREDAPETPIIVGSPGWTSLTKWAAESTFEGENLVYAGHIYPGDGKTAEALDPEYGAPAEEVPVMITEWGFDGTGDVQPGTKSNFGEPFREWLDGRENIGWTAWCPDSHWHPTMLDYDHNPTGGELFHGRFVKRWLAEARAENVPDGLQLEGADYEEPIDIVGPSEPGNPTVSENDDGTVTVAWDQTTDNRHRVMHYNVYVDGQIRKQFDTIVLLNEAEPDDAFTRTDLRFETTLEGFVPGNTYEIGVSAVDSLSHESAVGGPVEYAPGGSLDIHAEIPHVDTAPSIDGQVDDGYGASSLHEFQHVVRGSVDGEDDLGGGWRAVWDEEALYVLLDVVDDQKSVDSDIVYEDDCVEVYVDGDNSKRPNYDWANDFQLQYVRGTDGMAGIEPTDVGEDYAWQDTDDSYHFEVALPWSALAPNAAVESGHVIGFDAHVNDDDTGGSRDGKVNWHNEADNAWDNPSVLANVKLVE